MQSCLYRHHGRARCFCHFDLAAAFLSKGEQGAIFRGKLLQRMSQCIQLFRVHRPCRFGDILVLRRKRRENPTEFLPPQVIDAGVARQSEEPCFELRGIVQPTDRSKHLDEDQLRQVLDRVPAPDDRIHKPRNAALIAEDQRTLRNFVAPLSLADEIAQGGRLSLIHAGAFGCPA